LHKGSVQEAEIKTAISPQICCRTTSQNVTIYFAQGNLATDLRGSGSSDSSFLRRPFLNSTVKKKLRKLVHVCRSYC